MAYNFDATMDALGQGQPSGLNVLAPNGQPGQAQSQDSAPASGGGQDLASSGTNTSSSTAAYGGGSSKPAQPSQNQMTTYANQTLINANKGKNQGPGDVGGAVAGVNQKDKDLQTEANSYEYNNPATQQYTITPEMQKSISGTIASGTPPPAVTAPSTLGAGQTAPTPSWMQLATGGAPNVAAWNPQTDLTLPDIYGDYTNSAGLARMYQQQQGGTYTGGMGKLDAALMGYDPGFQNQVSNLNAATQNLSADRNNYANTAKGIAQKQANDAQSGFRNNIVSQLKGGTAGVQGDATSAENAYNDRVRVMQAQPEPYLTAANKALAGITPVAGETFNLPTDYAKYGSMISTPNTWQDFLTPDQATRLNSLNNIIAGAGGGGGSPAYAAGKYNGVAAPGLSDIMGFDTAGFQKEAMAAAAAKKTADDEKAAFAASKAATSSKPLTKTIDQSAPATIKGVGTDADTAIANYYKTKAPAVGKQLSDVGQQFVNPDNWGWG